MSPFQFVFDSKTETVAIATKPRRENTGDWRTILLQDGGYLILTTEEFLDRFRPITPVSMP